MKSLLNISFVLCCIDDVCEIILLEFVLKIAYMYVAGVVATYTYGRAKYFSFRFQMSGFERKHHHLNTDVVVALY